MWIKFLLLAKAMSVRRCQWITSGKFPRSTTETHKSDLDYDLLSPEVTPVPASVHWNVYNYKQVCDLWEKWPPKWVCLCHHTSSQEWEKRMSQRDRRDAKEKHKDRILKAFIAQGTWLSALRWPKREGNQKKRGCLYMDSWSIFLYSRN